jgi:hypothetical protein
MEQYGVVINNFLDPFQIIFHVKNKKIFFVNYCLFYKYDESITKELTTESNETTRDLGLRVKIGS